VELRHHDVPSTVLHFGFIQRLGRKWNVKYDRECPPHPSAHRSFGVSDRYVGNQTVYPAAPVVEIRDFPILINVHRENALRLMKRSFHTLLAAASDGNFDGGRHAPGPLLSMTVVGAETFPRELDRAFTASRHRTRSPSAFSNAGALSCAKSFVRDCVRLIAPLK